MSYLRTDENEMLFQALLKIYGREIRGTAVEASNWYPEAHIVATDLLNAVWERLRKDILEDPTKQQIDATIKERDKRNLPRFMSGSLASESFPTSLDKIHISKYKRSGAGKPKIYIPSAIPTAQVST